MESVGFELDTSSDSENRDDFSTAYLQAANAAMEAEASKGLDVKEWGAYAEYLEETLDLQNKFGISEEEAEERSEDLAAKILKMNRGVESLNSNWKTWGDILKKSSKESHEYMKALTQTKTALSDILDVGEEFISNQFIADNLELIGQAAEGSGDAIDSLGIKLATSILKNNINLAEGITFEFNGEQFTYIGD
jgi:hypothetical protein